MHRLVVCCLLAFLLTACSGTGPYKTANARPCEESMEQCEDAALVRTGDGYTLGFVEIDEQGILQRRDQAQNILSLLRKSRDQYVIVYIHGWHNSAKPGANDDVGAFRRRLAFTQGRYPNKKVTGIYVGWRGDSVDIPYLNVLTFWDRKNVSEEIGRNALLEFLLELETIKKNKDDRNILLLSGHSFGGSALFNATHQTLLQRLVQADGKFVRGFGDLVVLVNPAIESMLYAPLYDASQVREAAVGFDPDQPTILIAAGSASDIPVKTLFPIGRAFSTLFETHRSYASPTRELTSPGPTVNEGQMDRHSIAHFREHVTHSLTAQGQAGPDQTCPYEAAWKKRAINRQRALQAEHGKPIDGEQWTTGNRAMGPEYPPLLGGRSELELTHLGRSAAYSPYWVIAADHTVFPGHNDINQKHFWCLMDLVIQEGGGAFAPPNDSPKIDAVLPSL